ncbi:MAG: hypothetical protein ACLGH7_10740, partial [Actinomycetes bacterium]
MTSADVQACATGRAAQPGQLQAEYILPLRWTDDAGLPELADYLQRLAVWIPVTVVDGSPQELFARHRVAFPAHVKHIRPAVPAGAGG